MIRTDRAFARLSLLALVTSSGCSSSSTATGAAADGGAADASPAPRTAGVLALNQGDVHFDVAVPGVSLGTVRGDRNTGAHDTFVKMTAGSSVPSHWYTADVRGVVVAGSVTHLTPTNQMSPTTLTSGSFFFIPAMAEHTSRCDGSQDCLFLIYQEVAFGLTVNPGMVPTTPAPVNPSAKFVLPNTAKPTELIAGVASIASVDGDWMNRANGSFVTITRGQSVGPHFYTLDVTGVVVAGNLENPAPSSEASPVSLLPGGFNFLPAKAEHSTTCLEAGSADCSFFIHVPGPWIYMPIK